MSEGAKKMIAGTVVSALAATLFLMSSVQVFAHHTDAQPCVDIFGAGQPVPPGGVANSGVLQFDDPYQPSHDYVACGRAGAGSI